MRKHIGACALQLALCGSGGGGGMYIYTCVHASVTVLVGVRLYMSYNDAVISV